MRLTVKKTNGKAVQTLPLMREMVERYYKDMVPYAHMSLDEVFDFVKNVPYKPDPKGLETLQRPVYTMNRSGWGGDCDDKCIALASYCRLLGIPYRFVAVRREGMPTLHHVLCEVYINNRWINADPTYSVNTLGRAREHYAERVVG